MHANVVYREFKATEVCLGWFKFLSDQFQLNSSPAIKIFRLSFHREVPWTLNPVLAILQSKYIKMGVIITLKTRILMFHCYNPCAILVVYIQSCTCITVISCISYLLMSRSRRRVGIQKFKLIKTHIVNLPRGKHKYSSDPPHTHTENFFGTAYHTMHILINLSEYVQIMFS